MDELVQGGGAGFDQAPAVQAILKAAGCAVEWDEHLAGWASMERGGEALPEALLASVRANGRALKTKLLPPPGRANVCPFTMRSIRTPIFQWRRSRDLRRRLAF